MVLIEKKDYKCAGQQTELKSGDLNAVPKGAHELWSELKESLTRRPILQVCTNRTICNCCNDHTDQEGHHHHKPGSDNKDTSLSRVDRQEGQDKKDMAR